MSEIKEQENIPESIEALKQELSEAETLRVQVGGEAHPEPKHDGYSKVINMAASIASRADKLLDKTQTSERDKLVLASAGGNLMVANTLQSQAKHTIGNELDKDQVLGEALAWTNRLNTHASDLARLNLSLHDNPTAWMVEIYRCFARCYERRPNYKQINLGLAADFYQQAVSAGNDLIKQAEKRNDQGLLAASIGATGVALGELARIKDMMIHEIAEVLDETEIRNLYKQSTDMVWKLFGTPAQDDDRIDAVFGRFLAYLAEHDVSSENTDFQMLMENWKKLAGYSAMVKSRMQMRLEQNLVPKQYIGWFKN